MSDVREGKFVQVDGCILFLIVLRAVDIRRSRVDNAQLFDAF